MLGLARVKHAGAATLIVAAVVVPVIVHGTLNVPRTSADSFWSTLGLRGALEVEHYTAVDEMAGAADAVLVGSIGRITDGRVFGSEGDWVRLASATIIVHELLRGSLPPEHRNQLTLELVIPTGVGVSELRGLVPQARHVFFLRNKGLEVRGLGYSEDYVQGELPYYRLVIQRAIVADLNGQIHAPGYGDSADFLSMLEGRPFEDFVSTLRDG